MMLRNSAVSFEENVYDDDTLAGAAWNIEKWINQILFVFIYLIAIITNTARANIPNRKESIMFAHVNFSRGD